MTATSLSSRSLGARNQTEPRAGSLYAPRRVAESGPAILSTEAGRPITTTLLMIAVVTPIFFTIGPLALNPHRGMLLVVILPLLFKLFMGHAGRFRLTDGMLIAHIAWSAMVIAFHHGSTVIQFTGSNSVEFLGGYLVGRVGIRSLGQFQSFTRFYGLLVLLSFPFALVESQIGSSPLLQLLGSLPGTYTLPYAYADPRLGLERVQFTFDNAIHYGMFAAMALSLVCITQGNAWSRTKRLVIGTIIGLCSFLSLSSGAFLGLLFQLGFITWIVMTPNVKRRWVVLSAIVAVVYAIVEVLSDRSGIMVFLSYATFSPATAYWRTIIFDYGMQNVWANPIMGLGLNDWVRPIWMYSGSLDNFWLLMAMRYGLPGFAFLAIAWIVPIVTIARKKLVPNSDVDLARRAWILMIVALVFSLCTVSVWGAIYTLVFFCFGTGMWLMDVPDEQGLAPQPQDRRGRASADPAPAEHPAAPVEEEPGPSSPYTRYSPRKHQTRGPVSGRTKARPSYRR